MRLTPRRSFIRAGDKSTPRSIEREARNENIFQFAIWLFATIVGIVAIVIAKIVSDKDFPIESYVNSAISTFALSTSLYVLYRIMTFDAIARHVSQTIHDMRSDISTISSWERKRRRLKGIRERMIVQAGNELMDDYINMFEVSESYLKLKDKRWSLHFNEIFWRYLTSMSLDEGGGITVLVTHTSGVENWNGHEAEMSLRQQLKFIDGGKNRILRLFVHQSPADDGSIPAEYRKIMEKMEADYKIDTYYVAADPRDWRAMPDATWVPELSIFMTWIGAGADEFQIGSIPGEMNQFKQLWPIYFARAKRVDGSAPKLPDEIEQLLLRRT